MPGFIINGTGGPGPSNVVEVRRKHRWVFTVLGGMNQQELLLLQSAARPSFKLEPVPMHFNQEKINLAGKQEWEPIQLVWYDAEQPVDISRAVYRWLGTVVDLTRANVSAPAVYKKNATLEALSGDGSTNERWYLFGAWPSAVNWGEVNHTQSELLTVQATLMYDRAVRDCGISAGTGTATSMC